MKSKIEEESQTYPDLDDFFSPHELAEALEAAKDLTPVDDKITVPVIRHLSPTVKSMLVKIINKSWEVSYLPPEWKSYHSLVVPIMKPGKPPSSYRPIALTSCACKLMERMVHRRMSWYLEQNKLLAEEQIGFRSKRGTIDNLIRMEHSIQEAKSSGQYVVAITLDLEKTYGLIWTKGLIFKLHQLGIKGRTLGWIRDFLSDRSFEVKDGNGRSEKRFLKNDTQQGSVISPLLFVIMVNDLPKSIRCSYSGMYAEDMIIWGQNKNLSILQKEIEADASSALKWYAKWGSKVSPDKTTAVVFFQ